MSRVITYTLAFNSGFTRSNELRGTMFTDPASADPCDSGVGEYDTSIRERLLIEIMSDATDRPVAFPGAEAMLNPSSVTGTLFDGTPLMEISRALPPV